MGIYIPDMEMPTNCSLCQFCFGANNICPWVREYATCKGRHKDCPLIPVPPHGRLIDADALLTSKSVGTQIAGWGKMYHETCIEYAPTIIPADDKDINVPNKKEGE